MHSIQEKIAAIQLRIANACEKANRNPNDVQLLMATKTVDAPRIIEAFEAGATLIAENKIQELREKHSELATFHHTNHFIGHLQSNKVKYLLQNNVECLQSLDRISLAKKLQNRLAFEQKEMDVLIQVNTSNEDSKFGVSPENALNLTEEVAKLDRLHIKGLMTIGLFSAEKEKVVPCFQMLRELRDKIAAKNIQGVEMKELSMGMSHDFEWAIEEGATIVRVGTAIFGKRAYPDSYYWNEKK